MKPTLQPVPADHLVSWWLEAKPEGFTKYVEQEQQRRMSTSRIGQWDGRPFTADEVRQPARASRIHEQRSSRGVS